ncbi:Hypothetical protein F387_01678 [Wohlfahrtiimonas chitiniclastica SH04]|uniref:Uncharacterized protein n=1 Tax=Wohlfahrtiimonas chitiniclastica SH04 TaxID=1261130 RepID=L8XXU1_9GAMM|nr:Hypothetical protein F387_01678 [Wohlfahrtiimonas chitiniclastica SH04]
MPEMGELIEIINDSWAKILIYLQLLIFVKNIRQQYMHD